jgi:hypothetical protein
MKMPGILTSGEAATLGIGARPASMSRGRTRLRS